MKKTNKIILFIVVVFVVVICSRMNLNLRNTLKMSHSIEAPKSVYSFIKENIKIDSYYHDKAILVSFELDSTVIKSADETIFQFNSFGRLILYKHINGQISKLLIGKDVRDFNFIDDFDAPGYGFVIDANKLR